jgi:hypothetical protein
MQVPVQSCWKVFLLFGRLIKWRWEIKGKTLALVPPGEKSHPTSPFDMLRASCFTKGRGKRGGGSLGIEVGRQARWVALR